MLMQELSSFSAVLHHNTAFKMSPFICMSRLPQYLTQFQEPWLKRQAVEHSQCPLQYVKMLRRNVVIWARCDRVNTVSVFEQITNLEANQKEGLCYDFAPLEPNTYF